MGENLKKNNIKNKIIIVLVCMIIIGTFIGFSAILYNIFYNNNLKSIQTISKDNAEKTVKNQKQDEDLPISVELAQDEEEMLKISEEEKNKIEEEEKKQEQEQKKQEEEQKKQEQKNKTLNYPYYIKVNYTANTVTVYKKDSNGSYAIPVKAMVCSTGKATPRSGVYKTPNKYRWKLLIGNSYGQYSTRITGQILFHSVPYEKQSEDSLITRYYDRLGITTSLGCIRLTVEDAKWIYDNCPIGTSVEFYSSSNPGPLGKPSAKKIESYGSPLNKWDPTDPNPNNPWKNQNIVNSANDKLKENNKNTDTNDNTNKNNNTNTNINQNTVKNTNNSTSSSENNKISIANVVGKTENEAKNVLKNLTVKIEYKEDDTKGNGIVLLQNIKPGSLVEKGTDIILTVNKIQEINNGIVNINVKSLTQYMQQKNENYEIIQPKKVKLKLTVDDKEVYNEDVSEDSESINIKIKEKNAGILKIYIDGKLKKETQFFFDESNTILKVK